MSGFHFVCKKRSDGAKCSKTLSGESKDELLATALSHMSSEHGLKETMGLKQEVRAGMKKGSPRA